MSDHAAPNDTLPAAPSYSKRWPIIVTLVIFAAFEVWVGWTSSLPEEGKRATARGMLVMAHVLGQLLLGSGAFLCALFGSARTAIILLAANMILGWFSSSLFDPANWTITGFNSAQQSIVDLVVMPVAGIAAARLALRNIRLGLATFLVCLPTLYVLAFMAAFGISVMIRGS